VDGRAEEKAGEAGSGSFFGEPVAAMDAFDQLADLFTATMSTPAFSHSQPSWNIMAG
jgi:hypothetical protein